MYSTEIKDFALFGPFIKDSIKPEALSSTLQIEKNVLNIWNSTNVLISSSWLMRH